MDPDPTVQTTSQKPLRLWLGGVALALLLTRFVLPMFMPDAWMISMFGPMAATALIALWWAFFGRVHWIERWGAVVLMIAALAATTAILDKSLASGMMGMLYLVYSLPALGILFAAWAVFSLRLPDTPRRASMVATILVACGAWALLRTDGMTSDANQAFHWRWSQTREQKLLAQAGNPAAALPLAPVAAPAPAEAPTTHPAEDLPVPAAKPVDTSSGSPAPSATVASWPGFRGPGRDSIVSGIQIRTDWSASPPVELWRRPVGPAWSSFAVNGDRIYTQEQRGEDEIVACYSASTGKPVWAHRDATRFWESMSGPGPRSTPALSGGRVYTFGATGILNALDAANGKVLWSRNAATDTKAKVPGWGFASSPLLVGDLVIVAPSGQLAAYDAATGAPRWVGPTGGDSYSSPHLLTIDGVDQVLLMSETGAASVAPADGKLLWKYAWTSQTRIMQPAWIAGGGLLMSGGDAMGGVGLRRLAVAHAPDGWKAEEKWTSTGLKPNFNDFVVHEGHAYGFDGSILACIDLNDGKRKWKGGRYGAGQLVLLRDQSLLLVVSEEGGLALVKAVPGEYAEIAKLPAIEGKTWNHPVLAGDRLLVRNDSEMVAFRLALANR